MDAYDDIVSSLFFLFACCTKNDGYQKFEVRHYYSLVMGG
jgi:hypothetical protein